MLDYDVQRFSRQCCESNDELKPGNVFYSVLISEGARIVRKDYSEAAWKGAPAGAVGWWKSRVPDSFGKKMHWAPNDVILHYFEQLEEDQAKQDTRYVLALLMIRRRIVRLEDTVSGERGGSTFTLYCPRNEREYQVTVTTPSESRVAEIQNELAELLHGGAARG